MRRLQFQNYIRSRGSREWCTPAIELVGIFTVTDACRALAQVLEGKQGEEANDAA